MSNNAKTAAVKQSSVRALSATELEVVAGASVTYYEMGGHWYIIGHDKYGRKTHFERVI